MEREEMSLPVKRAPGTWVQTDRASHEAWAALTRRSGLAAQIMHLLAARVGEFNAVVISQKTLAELAGASRRGVQNALKLLEQDQWIQLVRIGDTGSVNAHVINDRVIWSASRDKLRFSKFSAVVIASAQEQPNPDLLDSSDPLRSLPREDERQIPSGVGLPPPVEQSLPGMELDLPASPERSGIDEPRSIAQIVKGIVPANAVDRDPAQDD
jgi:hypothetical protein